MPGQMSSSAQLQAAADGSGATTVRSSENSPAARSAEARRAEPGDLLRRFLRAYWLRPENAMWMTIRSMVLSKVPFDPPALDACCGDGVFSFLHAGGAFDPTFDVFSAVARLDQVKDAHADMFDHDSTDYAPPITTPPNSSIDVGMDLKPALLAKASKLDLYNRLVRHDGNDPLPFEDDSFQCVYCNAAYWLENIDDFIGELSRVTRRDGSVILQVKLDSMRGYTLQAHRDVLGDRWLDLIGRGRVECWPSLADRKTWEARFKAANLRIESATPFITSTHARIWDIGLRPIAPLLVRMTDALSEKTRASIKRDWVDLLVDLAEPLCDPQLRIGARGDEPAEIQYVLSPT